MSEEAKKPGFFSGERIKARWRKIGRSVFKGVKWLWPMIEDSVKEAITEEVERRLDKDEVPRPRKRARKAVK